MQKGTIMMNIYWLMAMKLILKKIEASEKWHKQAVGRSLKTKMPKRRNRNNAGRERKTKKIKKDQRINVEGNPSS